jgi:hypothetical protein
VILAAGDRVKGVIRPEKFILPDAATVPAKNLAPVPRRFTHQVADEQPYYYSLRDAEPAGTLSAGSRVRLASAGRTRCRVVDARGLAVYVACDGLTPLSSSPPA